MDEESDTSHSYQARVQIGVGNRIITTYLRMRQNRDSEKRQNDERRLSRRTVLRTSRENQRNASPYSVIENTFSFFHQRQLSFVASEFFLARYASNGSSSFGGSILSFDLVAGVSPNSAR